MSLEDNSDAIRIQECLDSVEVLFPDICPDYLSTLSQEKDFYHESVVSHILDQLESGTPYPKRPRASKKRKHDEYGQDDGRPDEDAAKRFDNDGRRGEVKKLEYIKLSKRLLQQSFPNVIAKDLYDSFAEHSYCLFPTLVALEKEMTERDRETPSLRLKKQGVKLRHEFMVENLPRTIQATADLSAREALEEFQAVMTIRRARLAREVAEWRRQREEDENLEQAQREGTSHDCECCYAEFAMNRMVHCSGSALHWFCRDCARRMAEHEIGLSKYHLVCMSVDGCGAGFSRDQRELFLDNKTKIALERIEQEAVLRLAGIENLETCPFCPFAAEYPPVELDKEFRCQNPECRETSCRLCRQLTHIPKTCAEAASENGHSARREIEEAMSAAMIRKCNKCGTPFIKENGCNKMTCTRNGCFNVQCYVCHKSCEYAHFNDVSRGGKEGNCPLFDVVEQRHEDEVRSAEERARKQVAEQNPGVDEELLSIKVSETVKADEERRKANAPRRAHFHNNNIGDPLQQLFRVFGPQPHRLNEPALEAPNAVANPNPVNLIAPFYIPPPAPFHYQREIQPLGRPNPGIGHPIDPQIPDHAAPPVHPAPPMYPMHPAPLVYPNHPQAAPNVFLNRNPPGPAGFYPYAQQLAHPGPPPPVPPPGVADAIPLSDELRAEFSKRLLERRDKINGERAKMRSLEQRQQWRVMSQGGVDDQLQEMQDINQQRNVNLRKGIPIMLGKHLQQAPPLAPRRIHRADRVEAPDPFDGGGGAVGQLQQPICAQLAKLTGGDRPVQQAEEVIDLIDGGGPQGGREVINLIDDEPDSPVAFRHFGMGVPDPLPEYPPLAPTPSQWRFPFPSPDHP